MKYQVTRFKDLRLCLRELEPFIRNGEHLQTGKPFQRFGGLRSRELLANWLMCVAVNSTTQPGRLTFTSDPLGGDGIIVDTLTEETWPTEHVLVPYSRAGEPADQLILEAIERKQRKGGSAYASGKTLVVFLNAAAGEWFPNKVAEQLPEALSFDATWVVGKLGEARARPQQAPSPCAEVGEYVYGVTRFDLRRGNAPTWVVRIGRNFDGWTVEPFQ